ncbi:glycosyltransferase family 87 protein [Trinickia fusca]|nr:glycosyltransferase family 87 protein [Trinickia fusca]
MVIYSGTILVLYALFLLAWVGASRGFTSEPIARPGVDFSVFWAASYLMLHGSPWQAYDHVAFATAEQTLFAHFGKADFLPWLYPPTYLLVVTPLALLPFAVSHVMFVTGSIVVFVLGTLRVSGLASVAGGSRVAAFLVAACPCVFVTSVFGQNALLTATAAAFAVRWLHARPVWAGLCIAFLTVKPQMGIAFPFVLMAVGAWRVFTVAALGSGAFALVSVLVGGGIRSIQGFLVNTRFAREHILEHSVRFHLASPTAFAALRLANVPLTFAYLGQGFVAVVAIVAACLVWRRSQEASLRAAALVTATLLANPYLWHYELAWLGVALACMAAIGLSQGWRRGEQLLLAMAWLLPLYEFFNPGVMLPQIGPLVLLALLWALVRRVQCIA